MRKSRFNLFVGSINSVNLQGGAKRPLRKVNNIDNNVSFQGKKGAILGAAAGIAVVAATGGLAAPLAALGAGYLGVGAAGIAGAAGTVAASSAIGSKVEDKNKG